MNPNDPHPPLADWAAILDESDADLAAGRIVSGEVVMRDFAEALARMEAKAGARTQGEASARR